MGSYKLWQSNTRSWFLERPKFIHWVNGGSNNEALVCLGPPGVGKTTMMSLMIEHIKSMEILDSVVYFSYFDKGVQYKNVTSGPPLCYSRAIA